MNLHGAQESSCCACCCVLFSRDNNQLRILPWYGRQEEESVFKYLLECACLESQGLWYMKEDPVLETMGTNGLYHLNRSRKTHLYRSNHVKKDPSEEDKQEGMDVNNVLQEMQAVGDLTASFLELLQRDVDVLAQTIHLLQMTNRPRFVSAKPPCLTGILASFS